MQRHPDKCATDHVEKATIDFCKLTTAWAVLSDPEKKLVYDQHATGLTINSDL